MAITVEEFFEHAREKLGLEMATGRIGLSRLIRESAINRPGLALAGFFRHFAFRRIQVLGMAECEYLGSLDVAQRRRTLRRMFAKHIPCLVVTRNRRLLPEIADLAIKYGVPVFRSPLITGHFINAATIIMESLSAPRVGVHGTMVDIMGIGVLIQGKPRVGKSEAALALIERGYSLVADDLTLLRRSQNEIIGWASPATRYHIEIRGLGIIHVPSLFGVASVRDEKALDLITTLEPIEQIRQTDMGLTRQTRDVLGVKIPHVTIPVAPGRELANIIEVATLNERLRRLGHDAAKELNAKLMSNMSKGNTGNEQ